MRQGQVTDGTWADVLFWEWDHPPWTLRSGQGIVSSKGHPGQPPNLQGAPAPAEAMVDSALPLNIPPH